MQACTVRTAVLTHCSSPQCQRQCTGSDNVQCVPSDLHDTALVRAMGGRGATSSLLLSWVTTLKSKGGREGERDEELDRRGI